MVLYWCTRQPVRLALVLFGASCLSLATTAQARAQPRDPAIPTEPTTVHLWGSGERPAGTLRDLDRERVWLQADRAMPARALSWDRVRQLRGPRDAEAQPFLDDARRLWRARARLERGDPFNAEPLFDDLAETYPAVEGPTSGVVWEGVLRCRLRRGAHAASIGPWLRLLRAGALDSNARFTGLSPLTGAASRLVPALPPLWIPGPVAAAHAASEPPAVDPVASRAEREAAAMALLYHAAAAHASGDAVSSRSLNRRLEGAPDSDDLLLVRDMVFALVGMLEEQEAARDRLAVRAPRPGQPSRDDWQSAWALAALGLSRLEAGDVNIRERGVLALIRVRVEHAADMPYLAGLALAHAAAAHANEGDREAAGRLARDLAREFTHHPGLRWKPITNLLDSATDGPADARPTDTEDAA